jgi:uncharacterized repeat protein (TIGR01451 family)
MKKYSTLIGTGIVLGALLTGCSSTNTVSDDDNGAARDSQYDGLGHARRQQADTDTAPKSEPAPKSSNMWGYYSPRLGENESASRMAFPTGDPKSSALLLHQVMPNEVRRGQDFGFSYHVTNLTNAELQNVMVMMNSASNLNVSDSEPSGAMSDGTMSWAMGDFGPGQTKIINLNGSAEEVGFASDCITVSYNNFLCATVKVVEPALALTKTATAQALKCDEVVLRYTVTNSGSGAATNVVIKDSLPNGLAMSNGSKAVNIPVGTLAAGESKAYEVRANASSTGEFMSPASASADGGLEADADRTTTVITAPELAVAVECSETQFLGRNFTYNYSIENNGDGVANTATASATIPAGTTVVRASNGGRVVGSNVVWDFGSMNAEASKNFSMTVAASNTGRYTSTVTGNASCADSVSDRCTTEVKGIPAILLEVVDITDPVEVGQNTTYVITVTNQGTAADSNIQIIGTLPAEQSFVSATGATSGSAAGKTVTFAPSGSLAPGAQISWRITVRADAEADSRFRVEMTSARLTSPVIETEATNLYE